MGENLFCGTLFMSDGTKFCEVEEIPVFTETYDPDNPPPPMPFFNDGYEITVTIDTRAPGMKRARRILLGWTAKGPLRWRQVRKALRMMLKEE